MSPSILRSLAGRHRVPRIRRDNLFTQADAVLRATLRACSVRSAPGCRQRSRRPSLTMKLACVGDTRAPAPARALQSGAIDQRAGRPGNVRRHPLARRIRILEDAAGARQRQRLRALAVRQRLARDGTQLLGLAGCRPGNPPRPRPRPSGAAGCSRRRTPFAGAARRGPHRPRSTRRTCDDVLADVAPPEMRVAVDGAADRARRAGPCLQARQAVGDRPAHESVDREARIRANRIRSDLLDVPSPRSRTTSPLTPASAMRRFEPPPRTVTGDAVRARDANRVAATRCELSTLNRNSAGPPTLKVVSGASGA